MHARRGPYRKGRYIVTYQLNRKNGKRHELIRFDDLQAAKDFAEAQQAYHIEYVYHIWDYNWSLIQ